MTISQAASVNLWREAILDRLAVLCMDAPQDEPPASILRRIIAAEVEIALDPSVSDAVPRRTLLQMALDALRLPCAPCTSADSQQIRDAITALREALAAPEPEPVMEFKGRRLTPEGTRECWGMLLCKPEQDPARGALLYAAPPAAPAPAAPVPDGWVMVPREPNEAMMDAGERAFIATARPGATWAEHTGNIYRAMIAASPAAPAAPVPDALVEAVAKAIYWEWRRDAGYVPWVDGGNSFKQDDARKIARAVVSSVAPVVPIDMVLHCPKCGLQHIDAPEDADCDGEVVHSFGLSLVKFCRP